jgi:hypothetical protein
MRGVWRTLPLTPWLTLTDGPTEGRAPRVRTPHHSRAAPAQAGLSFAVVDTEARALEPPRTRRSIAAVSTCLIAAASARAASRGAPVHRARDSRLRRDVALKPLPARQRLDSERRARLEREALALAALIHPNNASIHSVEAAAGVHALVMKLVDVLALADRIDCRGDRRTRFGGLSGPGRTSPGAAAETDFPSPRPSTSRGRSWTR